MYSICMCVEELDMFCIALKADEESVDEGYQEATRQTLPQDLE